MARQIKETPVLKGIDALHFTEAMKGEKDRVDEKTRQRMKANFKKLNAIATF